MPEKSLPALSIWDKRVVKSLCLEVNEFYNQVKDDTEAKFLQKVFQAAGVKVLPPGGDCDASLLVNIVGYHLGSAYLGISGTCYNGREVSGEISLSAPGQATRTSPIKYYQASPETIYESECIRGNDKSGLSSLAHPQILRGLWQYFQPGLMFYAVTNDPSYPDEMSGGFSANPPGEGLKASILHGLNGPDPVLQAGAIKVLDLMVKRALQIPEALPKLVDILLDTQDPALQLRLLSIIGRFSSQAKVYAPRLVWFWNHYQYDAKVDTAIYDTLVQITGDHRANSRETWSWFYPIPAPPKVNMSPYYWALGILITLETTWGIFLSIFPGWKLFGGRLYSRQIRWLGFFYLLPGLLILTAYFVHLEFPLWFGFALTLAPILAEILIRLILRPNPKVIAYET